jgi:hypothetical protein
MFFLLKINFNKFKFGCVIKINDFKSKAFYKFISKRFLKIFTILSEDFFSSLFNFFPEPFSFLAELFLFVIGLLSPSLLLKSSLLKKSNKEGIRFSKINSLECSTTVSNNTLIIKN